MKSTIEKINKFRDDRDWRKFHNEKDLAISILLESSELLELFQWKQSEEVTTKSLERIKEELADVLIYSIMLADNLQLDIEQIIEEKLEKNKDFKVIYTRKTDSYPSLTERTNLANKNKADLFVSMHCNASKRPEAYGSETFVQGPNQNKENLEVAKAENDVIYLDEQDRETFASYDPNSPESLIALKIQQNKYLESSLLLGGLIEDNFVNKDKRYSRGVKQQNLHVLRRNATPSVLVEMGFVSNYEEAKYISSQEGQEAIAESVYQAIVNYKKRLDRNVKAEPVKEAEKPMKTDSRILLMSSVTKYNEGDPAFNIF